MVPGRVNGARYDPSIEQQQKLRGERDIDYEN